MFAPISFFDLFIINFSPFFLFLAVFFGSFVFWNLLHKRASYKEFEIFDGFLLSLLLGLITGRIVFIALNWPNFQFHILNWFNIIANPGIVVFISIFTSSLFLWFWLKKHKIHNLEILDYWSRATCLGLVLYNLGIFLDGVGGGFLTESFLGVKFYSLSTQIHPAQLYSAAFFLFLFFFLIYLENNYRTFSWYRGNRSQAKAGFLFFIFLISFGLYSLISLNFQPANLYIGNFPLDWIFYILIFIFGLILLWKNSAYAHHKKN